jgi:hypothetical protein
MVKYSNEGRVLWLKRFPKSLPEEEAQMGTFNR